MRKPFACLGFMTFAKVLKLVKPDLCEAASLWGLSRRDGLDCLVPGSIGGPREFVIHMADGFIVDTTNFGDR